jgi:hypothetical protein
MPFLATDWASRRQVLLRYAASVARPLGWLAGAVGSLPRAWQEPLLQAGSGGPLGWMAQCYSNST